MKWQGDVRQAEVTHFQRNCYSQQAQDKMECGTHVLRKPGGASSRLESCLCSGAGGKVTEPRAARPDWAKCKTQVTPVSSVTLLQCVTPLYSHRLNKL